MYIDTHLHLSVKDYDKIDQVVIRAQEKGINNLIVSACQKEDMEESLSYMDQYHNVFYTFGFHPSCAGEVTDEHLAWLEKIVQERPEIVGIGEIGLDYHYGKENKELQKDLFVKQLKIAVKLQLPVVIHTRDAAADTIMILKQYPVRGIIHCFSGSLETAKNYIQMGFYLGIGGVLTFANSRLSEVVAQLPLENIVLETDSPYLTPVPYRGQKNEPAFLPLIAEKVAYIKQTTLEKIGLITTDNVVRLFDLPIEK